MMIIILATIMTVTMLIATAFAIREESENVRSRVRSRQAHPFLRRH